MLWSFALLLDIAILPALSATWVRNWRIIPLEISGVVGSVIMRWYLRRAGDDAERKGTIGFAMMLMNGARSPPQCVGNAPLPPGAPEIGGRRGSRS